MLTQSEYDLLRRDRERPAHGRYFPDLPVDVHEGARVAVVLLGPGGPECAAEARAYIRERYMDPVASRLPGPRFLRRAIARALASRNGPALQREYESMGGASAERRLALEQVSAIASRVERLAKRTVSVRGYVCMQYGEPSAESVQEQLRRDGIDAVVLVPMFPHYGPTGTGSALANWSTIASRSRLPVPTRAVVEYSTDSRYVQAVSERIDEGLQRFSLSQRRKAEIIFVGQSDRMEAGNPYCCMVHGTAEAVMESRGDDRSFRVVVDKRSLSPDVTRGGVLEAVSSVAEEGRHSILLVPLTLIADHACSAYGLDVVVRNHAEALGIRHVQVAAALNCHPLMIEAAASMVIKRMRLPGESVGDSMNGSQAAKAVACPRPAWGPVLARPCRACSYAAEPVN